MARYERHAWTGTSDRRARAAVGRWAGSITPHRRPPQSPKAQARYLRDEVYHGNTREMARAYGVSQRTVQRWIKGTRKMPREAGRLAREVSETRERRAARRARLAAARGAPPRVRAKGWIGPTGATVRGVARDTPSTRLREMPTLPLDPEQAAALAAAYDRDDPEAMRDVLAEVYGDYFAGHDGAHASRSGGAAEQWVTGADVGELDWIELE